MTVPPIDENAPLNQLRENRLSKNRDLKVIITSRNSTTGTGKTTLAVWLALNWDENWTAEKKGTLSVKQYLETYPDLEPGSVLLMDEAEQLDARRSMSQENVDFAERWMMMRVRNVTSILTLPTASALDKRLKELADVRINIHRRGKGRVYKITVDDHNTSQVREWGWHDITWPDLSDHPEMQALNDLKEQKIGGRIDENGEDDEKIELPKEEQAKIAHDIKKSNDISWTDAASRSEYLTYTGDYLRKIWNDSASTDAKSKTAASSD